MKLSLLFFVFLIGGSAGTQAALISLNQHDILTETDVIASGILVSANSVGSGPVAAMINGVNFGTDQSGLGNFTNGGGDFASFPPGGLDDVLSNLVFTPNVSPGTLTLAGLDTARTYQLQLLFSNTVNATGDDQRIDFMGGQIDIINMANRAVNVVAIFEPNSAIEVVSILDLGVRTILNGYALQDVTVVPEPSTWAILASALFSLALFGRRLRRR